MSNDLKEVTGGMTFDRIGASIIASGKIKKYPISARNGILPTVDTSDSHMIRRIYKNGNVAVKNIQIDLANWYVSTTGEQLPDNDEIRLRVSIEYPVGSLPRHFTVNGSDQITIPVGGTVTASELTGIIIPADEHFYIHTFAEPYKSNVNSGALPAGRFYVHWTASRDYYAKGTGVDLTDSTGGISTTPQTAPANLYSHVLLKGESVYNSSEPSLIIVGDSISYGFNENNIMSADDTGAVGPYERWAAAHKVGAFNLSVSSKKAEDWALIATFNYPRISALLNGMASGVVLALGRNDLPSRTVKQIDTDITTITTFFSDVFSLPCVPITITPASNSTDGWATLGNQTPYATNSRRIDYNTAMRARAETYIEVADGIESSQNSGKWTDSAVGTTDGIHPNDWAAAAIAASLPDPKTIF